jgi:hypothetical protein
MEHLDAHQIARLECLKLVASRLGRRASVEETARAADQLARFVMDGAVPGLRS